jgi:hypothetical protein
VPKQHSSGGTPQEATLQSPLWGEMAYATVTNHLAPNRHMVNVAARDVTIGFCRASHLRYSLGGSVLETVRALIRCDALHIGAALRMLFV